MKKRMVIGKKDGRQVSLEWELKLKNPNGSQYDIHNKLMNDKWFQLSISADSANWAGQAYDELLAMDETYIDQSKLKQLIEYWKAWHLNDMRPGCIHQKEWDGNKKLKIITVKTNTWKVKDELLSKIIELLKMDTSTKKGMIEFQSKLRRYDHTHAMFVKLIEKIQKALKNNEMYVPNQDSWEKSWFDNKVIEYDQTDAIARWTKPTDHPDGILGKRCDECQYTYGSKWLIEPLPDEVKDFFMNLHQFIAMDKQVNEIDEWMMNNGVKVHSIIQVDMNPHMPDSKSMDHWEYRFDCESKSDRFWYSTGYGHRLGHGEYNEGMKLSFKLNKYKKEIHKLYGNEVKINTYSPIREDEYAGLPKPPMPRDVFYQLFEDISYVRFFDDAMDFGSESGYDCNDDDQRREVNRIWYNIRELKIKLEMLLGYDKVDDFIETFCQ